MKIVDPISERLKLEESYLCLDFTNTMGWHSSAKPVESLKTYPDLVNWAGQVALVSPDEADELLKAAKASPREAGSALRKAVALREAIYRIFIATIQAELPASADLRLLNQTLAEAFSHGEITPVDAGYAFQWTQDVCQLDGMLAPIARSTADLLTSENVYRVGICEDDRGCGWLFYDTSRNRSRRWCSMESCGNRAKAHRHYKREKNESKKLPSEISQPTII